MPTQWSTKSRAGWHVPILPSPLPLRQMSSHLNLTMLGQREPVLGTGGFGAQRSQPILLQWLQIWRKVWKQWVDQKSRHRKRVCVWETDTETETKRLGLGLGVRREPETEHHSRWSKRSGGTSFTCFLVLSYVPLLGLWETRLYLIKQNKITSFLKYIYPLDSVRIKYS